MKNTLKNFQTKMATSQKLSKDSKKNLKGGKSDPPPWGNTQVVSDPPPWGNTK